MSNEGDIFYRSSQEILEIIQICKTLSINIEATMFHRTPREISEIIQICKWNNIPISGAMFLRTPKELTSLITIPETFKFFILFQLKLIIN